MKSRLTFTLIIRDTATSKAVETRTKQRVAANITPNGRLSILSLIDSSLIISVPFNFLLYDTREFNLLLVPVRCQHRRKWFDCLCHIYLSIVKLEYTSNTVSETTKAQHPLKH